MNGTSITVTLDTRRMRKDHTYPLILRLTHRSQTTSIKTGIHLKESEWDSDAKTVRKSSQSTLNVTRLNNEIQKRKAEALDRILKMADNITGRDMSLSNIKARINPSSSRTSFYHYSEKLIEDLIKAKRFGTARSYLGTINFLKTYNKGNLIAKNTGGNPQKKVSNCSKSCMGKACRI